MRNGNGGSWDAWKDRALSFFLGATLTLGGVWFTHVKNEVTRDEVHDLISNTGPYVNDRSGIDAKLAGIQRELAEIKSDLRRREATR